MNTLYNFFVPIDIFGKQIQFTYNQKSQFSTSCGGTVSIIVLIMIFAYLFFMLKVLFSRSDPLILTTVKTHLVPPNYTIFSDPFMYNTSNPLNEPYPHIPKERQNDTSFFQISIAFEDGGLNKFIEIDESMFSLIINQVMKNSTEEADPIPLKYKLCQRFHTFPKDVFDQFSLSYSYCIYDNYLIYGNQYSELQSFIELGINVCNNATSNNTCKDPTTLRNFFNKMKVHFFYSRMIINGTNYEDVVSLYINKFRYALISDYKLVCNNYLGANILESSDSIFPRFIVERNSYYYAYDFISTSKDFQNINDNKLLSIFIRSSGYNNYSKRTYNDIFQILGMVGGLSRIIFYIGSLFVVYISNLKFKESLINDFYSVVDPKNEASINRDFPQYLIKRWQKYGIIPLEKEEEIEEFDEENGLNKFFDKKKCQSIYDYFVEIYKEIKIDEKGIDLNNSKEILFPQLIDNIKEIQKYDILYNVFKGAAFDKMFYSAWEIFCKIFCFCCKTENLKKKDKIFKYATQKLNKDADFLSIVKSVQELEIFKKIYMNDDQLNLFNLTSIKSFTLEDLPSERLDTNKKHNTEVINKDLNSIKQPDDKKEENVHLTEDLVEEDENLRDFNKLKQFYNTLNMMHEDRKIQYNDKKLLKNLNLKNTLIEDFLLQKSVYNPSQLIDYNVIWTKIDEILKIKQKEENKDKNENKSVSFDLKSSHRSRGNSTDDKKLLIMSEKEIVNQIIVKFEKR
jgi:hypothetical protein